jgi:hypothetical protein
LWLLAIVAIACAHFFATSASQVALLLGCILAYGILAKLLSIGQSSVATNIANAAIGLIPFGLLIGLVFASFGSTQSDYSLNLNASTADSKVFFWSNIGLIALMLLWVIIAAVRGRVLPFKTISKIVLDFWFPVGMMYYFIKTSASVWFQVVAGVSLSAMILILGYNEYNLYKSMAASPPVVLPSVPVAAKTILSDLLSSAPYFTYVVNADLMVVAKQGMILALLAYVAYLIIVVYKFKNRLIPCVGTGVASCFDFAGIFSDNSNSNSTDNSNSADTGTSAKNTPYVNALIWALILSSGVNVANWIMQQIYNWANGAPSMPWSDKIMQLLKLVLFPVYWTASLFVNHPVGAAFAVVALAALILLLYRSSFDPTAFIEGQRGTVITLFTLFVASLIVFALYSATASTAELVQAPVSYGQFIGKTGLVLAIAVCIVGLLMYFLNSHSKLSTIVGVVQFGITALIYIAGIAVVIGVGRTMGSGKMGGSVFQVSPDSNWVINVLKLLGNLLFYLPCLMLDFVEMLKEQYGLTTRTWLIILAMEAAFILAGYFLPAAVAKAINHTGVQILSAPVSMAASIPIQTYDIQFVNAHGVIPATIGGGGAGGAIPTTVQLKNYSYGVSAWFYIHPQPPTTNANYSDKYINLLQLGSSGPSIQYSPKNNAMQFGLYGLPIVSSDKDPAAPLEVSDIPLQTWNNVVINSDNGAVDIFVNNKLIYTGVHVPTANDGVPHAVQNVTVGQADGVHGEMCNVVLNTAPFTKPEIAWLYKTNKVLNPPVVGVNMDPLNQGRTESDLAAASVANDLPLPAATPTYSASGLLWGGIIGAVFGILFGGLFNSGKTEQIKGLLLGPVVFGLIGALLGALFSTDGGMVPYVLKTVANVFVDTF